MPFAEIAVHAPKVQGVFHYHIPPELAEAVAAGVVVEVPFGRQRVYGVVLRLLETPDVPETKPVLAVPQPEIALTAGQLRLAERLAETTLAPLAACIALMLPPGVLQTADSRHALTPSAPPADALPDDLTATERRVLALLHTRGPLHGRQLDRALPRSNWRAAIARLQRRGWVESTPVLPKPAVSRKYERMVRLAVPAAEALKTPPKRLSRIKAVQARRLRLLQALAQAPQPASLLTAETEATPGDFKALEKLGLITRYREIRIRDPLADLTAPSPDTPPALTPAQAEAWAVIQPRVRAAAAGQATQPVLLHGVTGSGKTELYLRATAEALALHKQTAVLVPEIALTPQTIQRFRARFGAAVGVLHSGLSAGERYDTWLRVRQGEIRVLIGPRSALFAPFPDLGLIVVDECHEEAYFSSDRPPYYHAREAALLAGETAPAAVLLGTATPDVVTYARARRGRITLVALPRRVLAHRETVASQAAKTGQPHAPAYAPAGGDALAADLPPVHIVDMRAELRAGHTGIFSRELLASLETTLKRGEQAILFLNRRGSATYVFCRDCGHVMRCPRCDVPLTHHAGGRLLCHHCGYQRALPNRCPACGGERLRPYGAGTERVEAEVQRHFPQARTLRWDADTLSTHGGHHAILSHFVARRADVLIGTQMLAKGLDLPFVTLVGIVLADVGLTLPDYRAAERGFQLLTQVAGRAGRSPLGGKVVLQTYMPEHYAIQAAARHDFSGFYRQELTFRKRLGYPPYVHLVRLRLRAWQEDRARAEAERMGARLRAWVREDGHTATQIIGPAPCFFARERGRYCWHLILRGPQPAAVLRGRSLGDWEVIPDPPTLL